jgi:hypothetical protein
MQYERHDHTAQDVIPRSDACPEPLVPGPKTEGGVEGKNPVPTDDDPVLRGTRLFAFGSE